MVEIARLAGCIFVGALLVAPWVALAIGLKSPADIRLGLTDLLKKLGVPLLPTILIYHVLLGTIMLTFCGLITADRFIWLITLIVAYTGGIKTSVITAEPIETAIETKRPPD